MTIWVVSDSLLPSDMQTDLISRRGWAPWSIVLESVTCHLAVLLSPVDGILLKVLIEEKICARDTCRYLVRVRVRKADIGG